MKEEYVRIQKAANGKYVQIVLVIPPKVVGGERKQVYYSIGYFPLHNYIVGKSSSLYLIAKKMIPKGSNKYNRWVKIQQINKKFSEKEQKTDNLTTAQG